ncbi:MULTISPECIES: DegQ family serine endoprotease [Sulfitobacter]|jgi:serine protease Do|uniref:Probable periplasmic serine endoprotease DegP-like n=2 Tax=Sulfitobacter TaxID=60136 RepID=A0A1H2X3M5_9RHOB|nr:MULTISPECIES: DegQ family serine endoprotease [Sulfitobacter]PTA98635.1 DegQ family serine endoprotease [Sulfitobacter sp. CB-A]QPO09938.1 DegQ family serine endoprotease [Sulfitobacter sp. B30-2]ULO19245.1 DegQ family serine endoprotease [Sulfitobacter sp. CB2047]UOA22956.1 Periplasmic serine endoprotease DegP [Sulfitobacter pontiacus]UWR20178.1 DegQ family serine endoprotease [Sulfitobacter pontiacus]|tara:strand:+ start:4244 stop:5728 length:1485 start_codon:yes stop_codon:yes gene_type:complete
MQPKAVSLSRTDAISPQIKWLMMGMLALAFVLMQAVVALAKPESLAPLAEKISPSVVNITTSTTVEGRTGPRGIVPEGSPFEDFFKEFRDRNNGGEAPAPRKSSALGSGFVISEDGFVVTNNHVIEGADEITIEFFTGLELKAEVIGTDPNTDIALLKVEAPSALPFVSFGDSNAARVGDWVLAMGNPLGQGFSVSAGIVSARNRALSGTYDDYIQTDAAINRGNSGGPLFNMDGEVIGVNTAILSPNGGSIGIGFSMASNVVTRVVNQLKEFGETRRGWLGVRIQDVTQDVADAMGLAKASGALITDVPDGPAKDAGLKTGDVILSFAGVEVEDTRGLVRQVGNSTVGASVRVTVLREGKSQTLKVKLGRREDAEGAGASASEPEDEAEPEAPASKSVLGLTITPLTDDLRTELGADDSVEGLAVTEVDEMSEAFEKGLRVGDIITEAGQQPILSITDLEDRITEAKDGGRKSLLLLVRRAGDPRFVALGLGD